MNSYQSPLSALVIDASTSIQLSSNNQSLIAGNELVKGETLLIADSGFLTLLLSDGTVNRVSQIDNTTLSVSQLSLSKLTPQQVTDLQADSISDPELATSLSDLQHTISETLESSSVDSQDDSLTLTKLSSQQNTLTVTFTSEQNINAGDFIAIELAQGESSQEVLVPFSVEHAANSAVDVVLPDDTLQFGEGITVKAAINENVATAAATSNVLMSEKAPDKPIITIPEAGEVGLNKVEWADGLDIKMVLPHRTQAGATVYINIRDEEGNLVESAEYIVQKGEEAGDTVNVNITSKNLAHDEQYDISAYVVNTTGFVSEPSDYVEFYVDLVAPGDGEGPNGENIAPKISLIEINPSIGDIYINRADVDSVDDGISVPFSATIPPGTVAGNFLRVYIISDASGDAIHTQYQLTQAQIDSGTTLVDLYERLLKPTTPDGACELRATIVDQVGNESASSGNVAFTYDVTAPVHARFNLIDDASDTDVIVNDGQYSNDTLPLINGFGAEAGATIEIYDANNVLITTVTANGDGEWEYQLITTLSEGAHEFSTLQIDKAGNRGEQCEPFVVHIDLTPPGLIGGVDGNQDQDGNAIKFVEDDEYLNAREATNVSLTGSVEANGAVVSIILSDGVNRVILEQTDFSVSSGVISAENIDISTLDDGNISVSMTVQDQARNLGSVSDSIVKHPTDHTIGPIEDSHSQDNQVAQNSETGTYTGVTAFAEDLDGDIVTYQLIDSLNGLLRINSATGEIFLNDVTDLGDKGDVHQAHILATSSDGSTSTETFDISVVGNAISDLIDIDPLGNFVSENAPVDTYVGITAFAGEDAEDDVAYSLSIHDQNEGLFRIDAQSGEIFLIGDLDFETQDSHNINVIATSTDGSTATTTFTVVVGDNEQGLGGSGTRGDADNAVKNFRDLDLSANVIQENSLSDSTVGITAKADDLDGDEVTYRLSPESAAEGIFNIDSETGVITLIGDVDFESKTFYDVEVIAESYDRSTTNHTFRINVEDVNEAPIFTKSEGGIAIEMTAQVGDVVAKFTAQDPENDELTYSIKSGNGDGYVEINPSTGVVTLTQAGFDALHDNQGNITNIELTVLVSDGDLSAEASATVKLDEMVDPTIDLNPSSDSGESNTDHITKNNQPLVKGTGEPGASLEFTIDGVVVGRGNVGSNGQYNVRLSTLTEGTHEIIVTATDGQNVEESSMRITVDRTGIGSITIDDITNNNIIDKTEIDQLIDITGTVSGEFEAGDSVEATINGQKYQGVVNVDGTTWTIEDVATNDLVLDQSFSVAAQGVDLAGNQVTAQADTSHQRYDNDSPQANDDPSLNYSNQLLERDTFHQNLEGWTGGRRHSGSNSLQINKQKTATKVFDFGDEHAGQTVVISYLARGNSKWDKNGDRIIGNFNDVTVANKHSKGKQIATKDIEVKLDSEGKLTASFKAQTNATNEKAFILNFYVRAGDDFHDVITTTENSDLIIDVLANDIDSDGDDMRISEINGAQVSGNGDKFAIRNDDNEIVGHVSVVNGQVKFEPAPMLDHLKEGERLKLSFDYSITDDFLADDNTPTESTATTTFYVIGTNDLPVIEVLETEFDENSTGIVIGNISDLDGDLDLTLSTVTANNGTVFIDSDGDIVYTPNANYDGKDTVSVVAIDKADGKATETIQLTIRNVNNKPTAVDDSLVDTGTKENKAVVIDVLANDSDLDGDTLSITHINNYEVNGNEPIVIRFGGEDVGEAWVDSNNQIRFKAYGVLKEGIKETYQFEYTISDGQESDDANVSFTLTGVNDAPVITQTAFNVEEDSAANVIGHIVDIDGEIDLQATNASATNGQITIMANGNILYTPNEDFFGRDSVSIIAVDDDGKKTEQTLNVQVSNVNDQVGAISDFDTQANSLQANAENGSFVGITALAFDADPGDKVTYSLSNKDVQDGIFTIDATSGKVSLLDGSSLNIQTDTTFGIKIIATSSDGSTSTETFDINVQAGPAIELDIEGIAEGGMYLSNTDDEVKISGAVDHIIDGGKGDDTIHLNMSKEAWDKNVGNIQSLVLNFETLIFSDKERVSLNNDLVKSSVRNVNTADGNDAIKINTDSAQDVNTGAGNDVLEFGGNASGDIDLGSGNNQLTISGNATGRILAQNDNDTVTIGGDATGAIRLAGGNDLLTIRGRSRAIDTGEGNDAVSIGGKITHTVDLGTGNDQITITGDISNVVDGGMGNDSITLDISRADWDANLNDIQNFIQNFETIIFNDNTRIDNFEVALPTLTVTRGDDVIEFDGDLTQALNTSEGNDTVSISGSQNANITLGNGNNELDIAGDSDGRLTGGAEKDTIKIDGNASRTIETLANDDVVTIDGNARAVKLGSGDDSLTVGGKLFSSVSGGEGDDNITIRDSVNGDIDGGSGFDTLTLNMSLSQWNNNLNDIQNKISNIELIKLQGGESIDLTQWIASTDYTNGDDTRVISGNTDTKIDTKQGNDHITINGEQKHKVDLGSENNTVIVKADSRADIKAGNENDRVSIADDAHNKIDVAGGNDIVAFDRNYDAVILGSGNDKLTVRNSVMADIDAGSANDEIVVKGAVNATIDGGEGNDEITLNITRSQWNNNHNQIQDYITNFERINFKSGNSVTKSNQRVTHNLSADLVLVLTAYSDIVTSTTNLTRADLGDGDNELTVAGHTRYLTMGDGNDTVVLGSTLHTNQNSDQLDLGNGDNNLTIEGSAMGLNITAGSGNDTFNLAQLGPSTRFKANVDTGAGNDEITITEQAYANIVLGEGDDVLTVTTGNVYGDISTGAGNDIIQVTNGFTNNIDTGSGHDRVTVGDYTASVSLGSGNNTLNVTNAVKGALSAGDGRDVIKIGAAESTISLGNGDNQLTVAQSVTSTLTMGDGNDLVNIGLNALNIYLGEGTNTLELGGNITAELRSGDRDDVITVDGYVYDLNLGDGDNNVNIGGHTRFLETGSGNDTVTLGSTLHTNQSSDKLDLGDGNNTLVISGNAMGLNVTSGSGNDSMTFAQLGPNNSHKTTVSTGAGADTIDVSGIAYANFELGDGDDTLSVANKEVTGTIDAGAGSDTITVALTATSIALGSGDNNLTVGGRVSGSITAGDGVDTVDILSGTSVDLGFGDNVLVVENELTSYVNVGDGNDNITIGTSAGVIALGGGDNVLDLGTTATSIAAADGDDTISIGSHIENIHLGNGDNVIDIVGWSRYLSVGDGDDIVTLGATIHTNQRSDQLDLGDGDNTLTISGSAMGLNVNSGSGRDVMSFAQIGPNTSYIGDVNTGAGDDKVTVTGMAYANFDLADGNDRLIVSLKDVYGDIDSGAGDDYIDVKKGFVNNVSTGTGDDVVNIGSYANTIDLGSGDNQLTVGNRLNGALTALDGNDTVTIDSSESSINLGDGDNKLNVTQGVKGNINLGDGDDKVTIGGITSHIVLGDGENTLSVTQNVESLSAGSGKDVVEVGGFIKSVHLGDGDNKLTVGDYTRFLSTGDGNDTVTLGSTLHTNQRSDQLDLGNGNNKLTITGNAMGLNINTGDGVDVLNLAQVGPNTTYIANVSTGDGKDTVTVSGNAYAHFDLGGGNDSLYVTESFVHGNIDAGDGNDTIEVTKGYAKHITTGEGDDNVTVGDSTLSVDLGSGDNTLTVTNNVGDAIKAKDGNDIVTIGSASNEITLGHGENELYVTESVAGAITLGRDNDIVDIGANANTIQLCEGENRLDLVGNVNEVNAGDDKDIVNIDGYVTSLHLGAGDNKIDVGGYTRYLSTGDGNDVVTLASTYHSNQQSDQLDLGNGDNTLTITGNAMGLNIDTGSGRDILNLAQVGPNTSYIADVNTGDGRDTVTVTGTAYANFNLGDDDDTLTVTTSNVIGDIITGGGHDIINVEKGYTNNIHTGSGNDTVTVGNYTANVNLGSGRNNLTVTNEVKGDINAGDSKDVVDVGSVQGSIYLGDGANELTVTSNVSGSINVGSDSDIISLGGSVTNVVLGDGDNELTANTIQSVTAGDGNDQLTTSSNVITAHLGDGDNIVNVGGYTRYLSMGAGDDDVTLGSTVHTNQTSDQLDLGDGDNTLTISGRAMGLNITSGSGDDTFNLHQVGPNSTYRTDFLTGGGDDFITIDLASYANIDTGSGRDYLKLDGALKGTASGGGGHDAIKQNMSLADWESSSEAARNAITDFEQLAFNDITLITVPLPESVANGEEVGIHADLNDLSGDIVYSIVDENGKALKNGPFTIDSVTGRVTVRDASQIDYENQEYMDVIVRRKESNGTKTTETFRLQIADANDPVVAKNDLIATDTGGSSIDLTHVFTFDQRRLLSNDTDQDGDSLEVVAVKPLKSSTKGNVELNDDGTITFTPNGNFKGTATFQYTVSDGQSTDTATVTVKYQQDKTAEGVIVDQNSLNVSGAANIEVPMIMPSIEMIDDDGSESLIAEMSGIRNGFVLRDGTHSFTAMVSNNNVDISDWNLSTLTIQADANETSEHQMTLSLSTKESNGGAISSMTTVTFTVGMTRCPIILDLDGDGVETLGLEHGVSFDIDNDGTLESTGWVGKDDGLLVLDVNNDGIINNTSELIGQDTIKSDGQRALDGYDALRDLDSNRDGVFNADDEAWSQMQVWQDRNSDGISQQDEMLTFLQAGVNEISLQSESTSINDNGNIIGETGTYIDNNGNEQQIADVWLAYQEVEVSTDDTTGSDVYVFTEGTGLLDTISDFNVELDKLDFSELLIEESVENLGQYLDFNFDELGTTILISADGGDEVTSTIVLDGVDLSEVYGTVDTSTILDGLMGDDSTGALLISQASTTSDTPPRPLDDLEHDAIY
ncbi:MAG: tandem-95 repeat protein [Psychrobium sp.]